MKKLEGRFGWEGEQPEAQVVGTAVGALAVGEIVGEAKVVRYRISTCDCSVSLRESALRSCAGLALVPCPAVEAVLAGRHLEAVVAVVSEVAAVGAHSWWQSSVRSLEVSQQAPEEVEAPEGVLGWSVAELKEVVALPLLSQ